MAVQFLPRDQVELTFGSEAHQEWQAAFSELDDPGDYRSEATLRFECVTSDSESEKWTLYLRRTAGENKALVAHPEPQEWVGTVLLSTELIEDCVQKLQSKRSFSLNSLRAFNRFSNLKIHFHF